MKLRLMIEVIVDPNDVTRLAAWQDAHRHVMVDPGGDEPSMVGVFAGAVQVFEGA